MTDDNSTSILPPAEIETEIAWPNPRFDYSGAHVLVTGGTSGIGAGVATAYRTAGAHVTVAGTRASAAAYESALSADRYLQLDVEKTDSIDAAAGALDQLDIIVHCAGTTMLTLGLDEWEPDI